MTLATAPCGMEGFNSKLSVVFDLFWYVPAAKTADSLNDNTRMGAMAGVGDNKELLVECKNQQPGLTRPRRGQTGVNTLNTTK